MGKVDCMQDQMGSVSKEMEILKQNQKEMLDIKNTVIGMKKVLDELISRLDTAAEIFSDLRDLSIESSKTDKRAKTEKNRTKCLRSMGKKWKKMYMYWEYQKEEKEQRTEEIFETIMAENFSKCQDTKPQIHEAQRAPSSILSPKKLYLSISFSNYRKLKIKNPERSQKGEKSLTYRGKKIRITSNFSENT